MTLQDLDEALRDCEGGDCSSCRNAREKGGRCCISGTEVNVLEMTAMIPITKEMIMLGREWIGRHIRKTLFDATENAITDMEKQLGLRGHRKDNAKDSGYNVRLPCKVGDTLWSNIAWSGWYLRESKKPYTAKVEFIGINDSKIMGGGVINVSYNDGKYMMQFCFADIGKTVFLSLEEAEAELHGADPDTREVIT